MDTSKPMPLASAPVPLGPGSAVLPCGHGAGERLGNPWESSFLYLAPFCTRENRAPVASPTHAIAPPCDCAFLRAQKGASLRNRPLPACSSLTPSRLGSGVSKGISVALLREAAPGKGFSLLPSPLAVPGSAMSRPAPQYPGTGDYLKRGRGEQPPSLVADESAVQGLFVGEGDAGTPSAGSLAHYCTHCPLGLR